MVKWHIWSVNIKHYKRIVSFLESIPEVEDMLVPVMEKEYLDGKSLKKKVRETPLYGNYIFLKYKNTVELHNRIAINQFFYRYLGDCSSEESCRIEEFKQRNYREFLKEEDVVPGMKVKLCKEPFKNTIGTVRAISGNTVEVLFELFGHLVMIKCKISDLRTELWSAKEEDKQI